MAAITKPFTFTNGQTADGPQVNSNFDTLYTAANAVKGEYFTALATIPSGAGVIPAANVPSPTSVGLTAAPGSDTTATGLTITLTANENQVFGDVCFIESSAGKAKIAKADVIANASAVVMAAATISSAAAGTYLLQGIARNDAWNWTVGGLVFLSVTGTSTNTLTQTAPSATNQVVQILGVATHADRMYFNPQLVQVECV